MYNGRHQYTFAGIINHLRVFIGVDKCHQRISSAQIDSYYNFFFLYRTCCQVDRYFSHYLCVTKGTNVVSFGAQYVMLL